MWRFTCQHFLIELFKAFSKFDEYDFKYCKPESTQEEVTYQTPSFTPANTEEYTVNEYMEYDTNLNGDSYSITRNSDGMKGVLTIDSQANMQWYYYDAEGIHTN